MKNQKNKASKSSLKGVTLIELTVVMIVILALVAVFLTSTRAYVKSAYRASCVTQQEQIYKTIIGHTRMSGEPLEADVEYYTQLIADGLLSPAIVCPDGDGTYTITATDSLQDVTIICNLHGSDHSK